MENEVVITNSNPADTVGDAVMSAANHTVGVFTDAFISFFKTLCTWENLFKVMGACFIIFAIWLIFTLIRKGIKKIPETKIKNHYKDIALKFIKYVLYIIITMYVLSLFGVKLSAIWGAAGIAGIAIGFAAQTSVSNLISGLFVIGEKAMKVGDFIIVGGVSGTVDEVGLLSVKIHNTDGQMIRIPNSTIINSSFQNNSYFKSRRMTFTVTVAYECDLDKVVEVLKKVPAECPTVLSDPEPKTWYDGLSPSGIAITLAVWFYPSDLAQTKTDVYKNIVKLFRAESLEIPYNKMDVNIKQQ